MVREPDPPQGLPLPKVVVTFPDYEAPSVLCVFPARESALAKFGLSQRRRPPQSKMKTVQYLVYAIRPFTYPLLENMVNGKLNGRATPTPCLPLLSSTGMGFALRAGQTLASHGVVRNEGAQSFRKVDSSPAYLQPGRLCRGHVYSTVATRAAYNS